jgi:hypothetical protein
MSGDRQEQGRDASSMNSGLNLLRLLVDGHAACVAPFMRSGMGANYPGVDGLVGLVMILLYAAQMRDRFMVWYFWIWLAAIAYRRIETVRLIRRGWAEHSRYTGTPLALKLPFVKNEMTAKNAIEPAICFLIGVCLLPISEALGAFVMLGYLSLGIQRGLQSQVNRMRLRQMRDAAIEQRQLAERFRGERDDF